MNLNKLNFILKVCWSKKTCYPGVLNQWSNVNKSLGQCAISSLIVNDYFKGEIYKTKINGLNHYFNMINDIIIDFTKEQFNFKIKYLNIIRVKREDILKNNNTLKRYYVLKNKVANYYRDWEKLNTEINNCSKCKNLVDKFSQNETVYFGKISNILLIGEAPANKGWRVSNKIWKNIDGNLLPSGIVLQKLLKPLGIDLLDLPFTEAVKCFPKERKYLNQCQFNCQEYLFKQINLLNPKLIITLGNYATKCLLTKEYKRFNEVVGKTEQMNIGNKKITILPIYHPSPISPLSLKGNVKIFETHKILLKHHLGVD